jgi:hypothetical protein
MTAMRSEAFVVPFERQRRGRQVLMDTGQDSIFLWYSCGESWDRAPATVHVHKHDDVDETIIQFDGEGYYLHGPTAEEMVKTPWRGPCLLWMPAGEYHRVVTTSAGAHEAVLIYTPARAYIDPFEQTIKRAISGGEVEFASLPVAPLERAPEYLE